MDLTKFDSHLLLTFFDFLGGSALSLPAFSLDLYSSCIVIDSLSNSPIQLQFLAKTETSAFLRPKNPTPSTAHGTRGPLRE